MPLSTARFALQHVSSAQSQGPGTDARADTKIGGVFRRRKSADGEIHPQHGGSVQRGNLSGLPQNVAAPSLPRYAHGDRAGQRQVSPCHPLGTAPAQVSSGTLTSILACVQSAARPDRAGVETCAASGDAQPILCHAQREPSATARWRDGSRPQTSTFMPKAAP